MIDCAISPCPNDTFLFCGWIENCIDHPLRLNASFFDIETLNELAFTKRVPLIKLSCSTLGKLQNIYDPLSIGAALGFNQGPKVIAKKPFPLESLNEKRVAFPGKGTTAYLLFQDLLPRAKEEVFCLYHEVFDRLNEVDAGVIIHESRFTFQRQGFYEIADLGHLFYQKYRLPLALGALAVRCDLEERKKKLIIEGIKKSLLYAKNSPEKTRKFVLKYSQEKDPAIIDQHIALYVNQETEELSHLGEQAIKKIFELSKR